MITRTERLDNYHIVRETKKRTHLDDKAIKKHIGEFITDDLSDGIEWAGDDDDDDDSGDDDDLYIGPVKEFVRPG